MNFPLILGGTTEETRKMNEDAASTARPLQERARLALAEHRARQERDTAIIQAKTLRLRLELLRNTLHARLGVTDADIRPDGAYAEADGIRFDAEYGRDEDDVLWLMLPCPGCSEFTRHTRIETLAELAEELERDALYADDCCSACEGAPVFNRQAFEPDAGQQLIDLIRQIVRDEVTSR